MSQRQCVCSWKIYSLQQARIWRYLIYLSPLKGMCLHHSFIHFTWRILHPKVFFVCSISSTNRMTVLISIICYRMEDQIPFIYSYFTCRILYYLKAILSMNLGIMYWTISDAGCATKSSSSTTAVRAGTASTSTIWDQIFGRCIEQIWFLFFL